MALRLIVQPGGNFTHRQLLKSVHLLSDGLNKVCLYVICKRTTNLFPEQDIQSRESNVTVGTH